MIVHKNKKYLPGIERRTKAPRGSGSRVKKTTINDVIKAGVWLISK